MFNSLSSRWQTLKNKFNKIIPFVLCFVIFFFNPFSVYAADIDFTNYKTYVENNDPNSAGWMSGTSSTNGNINMNIDVIVTDKTVSYVSAGGNTGYNAALFIPDVSIVAGDVIQFDVDSSVVSNFIGYGIKNNYDSSGLVTYSHNYVVSDVAVSYGSIDNFTGSRTITFTSNQDGYFYLYGRVRANHVLNCTFSNISVNGSSVGGFTAEEILNNGDSNTQGIVDSANDSNDLLNSVVSDYKDIEDSMLSNFNQYQAGILSDINSWSWGGLAVCANWVGETMTNYYNNLGDFKQYIIYPLLLGIALFFIGRGSTIIGHLFRKPTVRTTFTESTSTRYRSGNHSGSSTSTTTYREGGVFRK